MKLGRTVRDNDRRIVGQRVVAVRLNKFGEATVGGKADDPTIVLENGVELRFHTQETEQLDYGTRILVMEPE
jgi:hypothetical protein